MANKDIQLLPPLRTEDSGKRNGGVKVRKEAEAVKEIEAVIEEATKLLNKNPHLKIYQALALAKEALKHGGKYSKTNTREG